MSTAAPKKNNNKTNIAITDPMAANISGESSEAAQCYDKVTKFSVGGRISGH